MRKTQETQFQSLGWEDPLEEGMATHSRILAGEIPWTEEPGRLLSMGLQRVGHDLATKQRQQHPEWHTFIEFYSIFYSGQKLMVNMG